MSEIQKKWRCEKCFGLYDTRKKAVECAASHVHEEVWVMCRNGAGFRVFNPNGKPGSYGSMEWALEKAKEMEREK